MGYIYDVFIESVVEGCFLLVIYGDVKVIYFLCCVEVKKFFFEVCFEEVEVEEEVVVSVDEDDVVVDVDDEEIEV